MRKAKLVVNYSIEYDDIRDEDTYYIHNVILVNREGKMISLYMGYNHGYYECEDAHEMVDTCVEWSKLMGYKIDTYKEFGAIWCDINFINVENGSENNYPYKILNER